MLIKKNKAGNPFACAYHGLCTILHWDVRSTDTKLMMNFCPLGVNIFQYFGAFPLKIPFIIQAFNATAISCQNMSISI